MAGGEADGSAARAAPAPNPPFAAEGAEPVFSAKSPALAFHLHAVDGRARASTVHLPHGPVRTPVFMPACLAVGGFLAANLFVMKNLVNIKV